MKVICKQHFLVNLGGTFESITTGKEYEVIDNTSLGYHIRIKLGNYQLWFPKYCFYTIKELRKDKLNKLNEKV